MPTSTWLDLFEIGFLAVFAVVWVLFVAYLMRRRRRW